jgi:hypothetical protein
MNTQTEDNRQNNRLLTLADEMASAASHFSSHGYDEFVQAREQFVQVSNQLMQDLLELQRLCKRE